MYDNNLAEAYRAMGLSYFLWSKLNEATASCTKALVLSPGDPVMLYNAACMYVGLGESVRAIDALRQAVEAGYTNFGWMQNDPDLVSLRDDPAFIEMLRDLSSRPTSPSAS